MKEVLNSDQPTGDAARSRRKRVARTIGHVVLLLIGSTYLLGLVMAIGSGYLSWIGIVVGSLLTVPGVVSPILGLAGRKRLEAMLDQVSIELTILMAIVMQVSIIWAGRDDTTGWRLYRFDDDLAAIEVKRGVADEDNAALRYDALFAKMDVNDRPDFIFLGASARDEFKRPWKSTDYPQVSAWLDSQSGTIDRLLDISTMEKCRWPVQADWFGEYTVPYEELRHCAGLLTVAANRDLGEDRVDAALAKCFCLLRMGDHLHQQPSTLDALAGFACEGLSLPMIRHILVQGDLSNDAIARVVDHLPPTVDLWPQQWIRLIELEKLHYMNFMGRLYEVNDNGDVRFTTDPVISPKDRQRPGEAEAGKKIPRMYWVLNMPRDPRGIRSMADEYLLRHSPLVGGEHLPQTDADDGVPLGPADLVKGMCNFYRWGVELALASGEVVHVHHRWLHAQAVTRRRGTWLVLGLRRYRDAHGIWPEALDDIAQYIPSEASLDPTGNEAFVYVRDSDGFRLYSKGLNGTDDGGRHGYVKALDKLEDDIPLWPLPPSPEPSDKESLRQEFEAVYGREYVEEYLDKKGSDKR